MMDTREFEIGGNGYRTYVFEQIVAHNINYMSNYK